MPSKIHRSGISFVVDYAIVQIGDDGQCTSWQNWSETCWGSSFLCHYTERSQAAQKIMYFSPLTTPIKVKHMEQRHFSYSTLPDCSHRSPFHMSQQLRLVSRGIKTQPVSNKFVHNHPTTVAQSGFISESAMARQVCQKSPFSLVRRANIHPPWGVRGRR